MNHSDYSVGWICALALEFTAARCFLDKEHEPLDQGPSDDNKYVLGEMGGHNVVIAVLPEGEYGIASATGVAKDLRDTFPSIKIGLMVGIAGGAPTATNDIRLGDVVVSSPSNGPSGVFQYDFGKTVQDQSFHITGHLDQPPRLLRAAVNGLRSQYEIDGHTINEAIQAVFEKKPRLKRNFSRPSPGYDKLYHAGFVHDVENCCSKADVKDALGLVERCVRTEEDDDPAIHYGLIASGNQLIKDAMIRDKLAAEKGVLCFEMEAAGLMNHFPCLVVRGICDYADSHKNNGWQRYASMTAAAYARDLLYQIQPSKMEAEKSISELVSVTAAKVERCESIVRGREDQEILNWLTEVDYGLQQSDIFKRVQPNTGQWFLESEQYQSWMNGCSQTLFRPGIPGAGKTLQASIVINYLLRRARSDSKLGVAYIYCNYGRKEQQTVEGMVCSLIKQLTGSLSSIPQQLKELFIHHKKYRTRPALNELRELLQFVLGEYSTSYIVVDALDECEDSGHGANFIQEILSLQEKARINILATSRSLPRVQEWFKDSSRLEIRPSRNDIQQYISNRMPDMPPFISNNQELREEILTKVFKATSGMFLLAHLCMHSLQYSISIKAVRSFLDGLNSSSDAYGNAYTDAMNRIHGQHAGISQLANRALMWIAGAKKPLSELELRYALSIETNTSYFDKDGLVVIDIASICAGLVAVGERDGIIRLVHYTAQQFFERTWTIWFPNGHGQILETCITYLCHDDFDSGSQLGEEEYLKRLYSKPFYSYAAFSWGHHASRSTQIPAALSEKIFKYLEKEYSSVNVSIQGLILLSILLDLFSGGPCKFFDMTRLRQAIKWELKDDIHQLLYDPDGPKVLIRILKRWISFTYLSNATDRCISHGAGHGKEEMATTGINGNLEERKQGKADESTPMSRASFMNYIRFFM